MNNRIRHISPRGPRAEGPAEKAKNFKRTIIKLLKYCKRYMTYIVIALLLTAISSIFTIMGPSRIGDITDLILEGMMTSIDLTAVSKIATFLVIIYSLGAIFNYVQGFIMATITQHICRGMRNEITRKINKLPLKYFDNNSHGDVLSRITNDVDTLGQTINNSISTIVSAATLLLGSLIMMFLTNYVMTISALIAVLIGFILMAIIMSKSQKYFIMQQEELGKLNGHIEEIYSGLNIVKVYNGEKEATEQFREFNSNLYESAWKSQFLSGLMMPIMMFVGNFGYVVVCIVGAILAMNGTITFSTIVAFMIYIRLFTQPLGQLAQAATSIQSAAAAGERAFEFLEEEELADETHKIEELIDVKGDIEFKNVKFGYDEDRVIIKDFSARTNAGEKIAIVGPTGAGKTTMVNLLMRFYEINEGDILIDGKSIKSLTRERVHDLFCMVLQDTWLFEGSIKENLIYSNPNATEEDVIKACQAVGVDHLIRTLPQGYDTIISDATNLSAGEKQLITIARALIEDSPFLILDEATSNVDTRTEILIQQAMDKLMHERTTFVIAHRLSTIKNADLILVMHEGDIVESGNHDDLLKRNGFYAELYNSQFETLT